MFGLHYLSLMPLHFRWFLPEHRRRFGFGSEFSVLECVMDTPVSWHPFTGLQIKGKDVPTFRRAKDDESHAFLCVVEGPHAVLNDSTGFLAAVLRSRPSEMHLGDLPLRLWVVVGNCSSATIARSTRSRSERKRNGPGNRSPGPLPLSQQIVFLNVPRRCGAVKRIRYYVAEVAASASAPTTDRIFSMSIE